MEKHRVAIYIRVSTKKQVEEGYSLDAQKERLEKLSETNGYIIYKIYADEGKSGKDTNRPAFQEMMEDMRNREFDKILVMKLDRISRSVIDLELMIKEMQKYEVDFESASEKIDTSTSFGMMFIRLLAIFAQFERERIKERITDAFDAMVKEGKPISGSQPFGYKIENGKVVIDEEKEQALREFFDVYEKTNNMRKTVLYINEKYDVGLNVRHVYKMVENTVYYGEYRGNKNYCPAYITKERWENINKIREEKRLVKTYHPNRTYLFSGLLLDTNCHTRLASRIKEGSHKNTYYYRCNKAVTDRKCISNRIVNEGWVEEYLLNNLNRYINDYFNQLEKEYKESKVKYKDATKEIALLKEELRRTTISFNKGRMEEEEYDKEWVRINNTIKKLEKEPVKKDTSSLKDLMSMDWQSMYKELTRENKQAFWRSFIDKIELDPLNYKNGEEYIKVILK